MLLTNGQAVVTTTTLFLTSASVLVTNGQTVVTTRMSKTSGALAFGVTHSTGLTQLKCCIKNL